MGIPSAETPSLEKGISGGRPFERTVISVSSGEYDWSKSVPCWMKFYPEESTNSKNPKKIFWYTTDEYKIVRYVSVFTIQKNQTRGKMQGACRREMEFSYTTNTSSTVTNHGAFTKNMITATCWGKRNKQGTNVDVAVRMEFWINHSRPKGTKDLSIERTERKKWRVTNTDINGSFLTFNVNLVWRFESSIKTTN